MKFRFEGMDSLGQVVKGLIEAESRDDAYDKVRERGIFPTAVTIPKRKKSDPEPPKQPSINYAVIALGLALGIGVGFLILLFIDVVSQ